MMLREIAPPALGPVILDELARHMRLSPDMATPQEAELGDAYVAAVTHLEAMLGLCLAPREFTWRVFFDGEAETQLPIGPVRALTSVSEVRPDGGLTPLEIDGFRLRADGPRSTIQASSLRAFDVEITFDAGFGAEWSATPADLRRAVLMLAAHFFEERHAAGGDTRETVHAVAALIQPWRPIRLTFGGA